MEKIKNGEKLDNLLEKHKIHNLFTDPKSVIPYASLIKFKKGRYIYEREEDKRYVYFLVEGSFGVYANTEDGKKHLIRFCEEEIFIGDMEILGYEKKTNTIYTLEDCLCIGFELAKMKEQLKKDIVFSNFICKVLAEKIVYFSESQLSNKMNTAYQNLASYILAQSKDENKFNENLVRLAEVLGISYRHLHRVIKKFIQYEILSKDDRVYIISSRKELEKISKGNLDFIS